MNVVVNIFKHAINDKTVKLLIVSGAVVFYLVDRYIKSKKHLVHNHKLKGLKKDTLILHVFGKGLKTPAHIIHPLILETWVRMNSIPYERFNDVEVIIQRVYITYNDQEIEGYENCVNYLNEFQKYDLESHLSEEQKGISRSFVKLAQESLKWVVMLSIYVHLPKEKLETLPKNSYVMQLREKMFETTCHQGYGRHTKEEIYEIGFEDLKSINDYIGNKKFLFGDKPCLADASIFVVIAQIIKYNRKSPLCEYVENSCPNIKRHFEAILNEYWSDIKDELY